jgi:hypothetical protein
MRQSYHSQIGPKTVSAEGPGQLAINPAGVEKLFSGNFDTEIRS